MQNLSARQRYDLTKAGTGWREIKLCACVVWESSDGKIIRTVGREALVRDRPHLSGRNLLAFSEESLAFNYL